MAFSLSPRDCESPVGGKCYTGNTTSDEADGPPNEEPHERREVFITQQYGAKDPYYPPHAAKASPREKSIKHSPTFPRAMQSNGTPTHQQ